MAELNLVPLERVLADDESGLGLGRDNLHDLCHVFNGHSLHVGLDTTCSHDQQLVPIGKREAVVFQLVGRVPCHGANIVGNILPDDRVGCVRVKQDIINSTVTPIAPDGQASLYRSYVTSPRKVVTTLYSNEVLPKLISILYTRL